MAASHALGVSRARLGLLTLPRFLGIGAQKAGTTWLYAMLRRHPGLFLPQTKELHYFDRRLHEPIARYAAEFAAAGDRLPGEITPAYGTLRGTRFRLLRAYLPRLKAVYLVRHPVDRVWSALRMLAREELGCDAGTAPESWLREQIASERVRIRTAYRETYELWCDAYGEDRVMLALYDEIERQPAELLRRAFDFLGVDPDIHTHDWQLGARAFAGDAAEPPAWVEAALSERFQEEAHWVVWKMPEAASDWSKTDRLRAAAARPSGPTLDADWEQRSRP